jgi:hypothetical protein
MAADNSILGRCPNCGAEIPQSYVLIEYETNAGEKACFAECPECLEVVAPE